MMARALGQRTRGSGRQASASQCCQELSPPPARPGRGAGCIGRELVQKLVARPAADDADLFDLATGEAFQILEHAAVFECQAFQHGARISRRELPECVDPSSSRNDRSPRHIGPGGGKLESSGSTRCANSGSRPPRASDLRSHSRGPRRPGAAAALQHPKSHHILQQAHRAADSAFIGEVQARASAVMTGASSSMPNSDHVPELRNAVFIACCNRPRQRNQYRAKREQSPECPQAPRRGETTPKGAQSPCPVPR